MRVKRIWWILLGLALTTSACATPAVRALGDGTTTPSEIALLPLLDSPTASPIVETSADSPTISLGTEGTSTLSPASPTPTTDTLTPTDTATSQPTFTFTSTPPAVVPSISATVSVGFLSCRYGPGPEYLYLYALRQRASIQLVGRTDSDNWHWAWVEGRNRCWVNTSYLSVQGDWRQLPVVYPGTARLPVSPYYRHTAVTSAVRRGNQVTINWIDIPLRAGDEEDEFMQHYVIEVWHCVSGQLLFEPLATNDSAIQVTDEPGCRTASHGRVFLQEKHGFAGPAEIPWPPYQ